MTVAIIFEAPGATEGHYATARRMLGAALQLGNLVQVPRPVEPVAASPVAASGDGEPTWEDAAWQ